MFPDRLSSILNRNPYRGGVSRRPTMGMADVRSTEYTPALNASSVRLVRGVRVGGVSGRRGGVRGTTARMYCAVRQPV